MAPRTAKGKKAADVKVADLEAPKKGRGKAKNIEEAEQKVPEVDIDEKPVATTEKKSKRGKKALETNGDVNTNGSTEQSAPPAKRGRKKKELEEPIPEEKPINGDHSAEEVQPNAEDHQPNAEDDQSGDHAEANGVVEIQPAPTGKGRKKAAKKEEKPKETGKGKKKQASPENEEDEAVEEKPKGKGRGRKAKAEPAPEPEEEEKTEEEAKTEPTTKGKKKAPAKAAKENSPEIEKESADESEKSEPQEEKTEEAKKETKGKKGKKAAALQGEESEKEPASKKRKVTKKEEKAKGDAKEDASEDGQEQESQEVKPAKGKRGKKADAPAAETEEEPQDSAKRRRKPAEDNAQPDSKKKPALKNKTDTNYEELDFSNNSKSSQGKDWNFKISSWNVDGIRSWMNKGGLEYIKYEKPDILCLQEVKCAQDKLPAQLTNVPGYHAYWLCSDKDGYAGVGVYTTQLAMNVQYGLNNKELDDDGRIITAEYEQFYLICTYVPNAGRKLVTLPKRLQWNEEFRKYVKELDQKKPVIICGDMNVAHNEIDLANPKTNRMNAGFTKEERAGMSDLLSDGFVDTYRHLYPDKTGVYTFWTYMMNSRSKNVGWRLDYFIVSERLLESVCDMAVRAQVYGSDHCPITLFLHLSSAVKPKEE